LNSDQQSAGPEAFEELVKECDLILQKSGRDGESRDERIWAAGFFDGEGHVAATDNGFDCSIDQITEDLINLVRFRNAVGTGRLSPLKDRQKENHRPQSRWLVTNQGDLQKVFEAIGPFLNPAKVNGRAVQNKAVANPPRDGFARALALPIRTVLSRDGSLPEGSLGYEPQSKRVERDT
jgi:hypothetical protein